MSEFVNIPFRSDFIVPSYPEHKIAMTIWPSFYHRAKGEHVPSNRGATLFIADNWGEFYDMFAKKEAQVIETKGEAIALSPGIMTYGSQRSNLNTHHMSRAVALDLDDGDADKARALHVTLVGWNISHLIHTSHSHGAPGKGARFRAWIEMDSEVPAGEWRQRIRALMIYLTGDADGKIAADKSCVDPARVYYGPSYHPDRAHLYAITGLRDGGVPLQWDTVMAAVGAPAPGAPLSSQTDAQRAQTLAYARMMSTTAKDASFSKEDLVALSKDKKRVGATARAAFAAAAQGYRMVVVKGEARASVLSTGMSQGGDLADSEIDTFLTRLMYTLAVHHPGADPAKVEAVFSASVKTLQDDDVVAGNVPYGDDDLRKKFESAVLKVDMDRVAKAKSAGLPTVEEFKAAQGDVDLLKQKVFLGDADSGSSVLYKFSMTADGPKIKRLANFNIVVLQKLIDHENEDRMKPSIYLVKIVGQGKSAKAYLPLRVLNSVRSFLSWLKVPGMVWEGTDLDVVHLRETLELSVQAENTPTYAVSNRVGVQTHEGRACTVTPLGTFVWVSGFEVTEYLEPGAPMYYSDATRLDIEDRPNQLLVQDLQERRGLDVDVDVLRSFSQNIMDMNSPKVMEVLLGWYGGLPLKPLMGLVGWRYPYLTIVGTQGSGKSTVSEHFAQAMSGAMISVKSMPSYSLAEALSGNTSFPILGDEFRETTDTLKDKGRIDQMRNILRSNYDGRHYYRSGMAKIRADAPVIIVGEQASFGSGHQKDQATSERSVVARPRKGSMSRSNPLFATVYAPAKKCLDALMGQIEESGFWILYQCYISARYSDLSNLAAWLDWGLKEIEAHLASIGRLDVDLRHRKNLAVLRVNREVWNDWCNFLGIEPRPVDVAQLCADTLEEISEGQEEVMDPVGHLMGNLSLMVAGEDPLRLQQKFWLREGDDLYLHVAGAMKFFLDHRGDKALVSNTRQLWTLAESSPFVCSDPEGGSFTFRKRIRASGLSSALGCLKLSIPKLQAAGVSLSDRMLEEPGEDDGTFS